MHGVLFCNRMKKRILVVEDEQPILQFLHRGLIHKGFETILAVNGEEALKAVHDRAPDLVVLDVMLPDFDGVEVCRYLRSMGNETLPILMLTARDELTDKIAGLNSGADDYITKPFDFEELVARIRAALRRVENTQSLSQIIEVGDLVIDESTHQVTRAGKLIELTRREYDLLELLAQNVGHVLSKERIFERVWGYDNEAGLEVIKVYINYLRVKLNSENQPDLIHAVRGVGYMLKL
jgi:DNA-binding response OmpR family regulator